MRADEAVKLSIANQSPIDLNFAYVKIREWALKGERKVGFGLLFSEAETKELHSKGYTVECHATTGTSIVRW